MPIEFGCASCGRQYRVKDELAGKSAKCGKCGQRMKIPTAISAKSASVATADTKSTVAQPVPRKPASSKTMSSRPVAAASAESGLGSWLDEELESAPAIVAPPRPAQETCPSCEEPMTAGAVLCVKCGYDSRIGGRRAVQEVAAEDASDCRQSRPKFGSAASLLRGTLFSFLAALLGAVVWAVLAYFTMREFGFIAWGLGGLAGLGMALGHEDDDGTFAGIIAAFMSLLGILATKILIIVIIVGAAVAVVIGDPTELQRSLLAGATAHGKLEAKGIDPETASDQQWEDALAEAHADVAELTAEQIEERFAALDDSDELRGEVDMDIPPAAPNDFDENELAGDFDDAVAAGPGLGFFALLLGALFRPIDGLFILLAFFTAYKVGSGQTTN